VLIAPRAEIERHARKEYAQRYSSVPEPRFINASASVSFSAPRRFMWGGVGYYCPPLSYENGLRLFAAAQALREAGGPSAPVVLRMAVRVLRSVLHARRRPLWRYWSRAFYDTPAEHVEMILRGLLYVEDESPPGPPPEKRVTVDLLDNKYAFEACYKRKPESWADYTCGLRHIARTSSRGDLRGAVAFRVASMADKKTWRDYERDLRAAAGWN
jgi:hypothetical protein